MSGDLARWLREARELLAEAHGPCAEPIDVEISCGPERRIAYRLPGACEPNGNGHALPALSPDERAIVAAILGEGNRRTEAKKVARLARLTYGAAFRAIMTNLTERVPPVLEVSRSGYVVVGALAANAANDSR